MPNATVSPADLEGDGLSDVCNLWEERCVWHFDRPQEWLKQLR
jgi:hypothetical protein